jgi:two-component system chemotaxis sensor kinase CheA
MDKEKLIKRLLATFHEELGEHVAALNRDLLVLEKSAGAEERAERLKTLLRTAHSLKGAARSVNAGLIEDTCHQVEEILTAARDGLFTLAPDLFSLLFATADAIEEAGMRFREQQDLGGAPLAALLPRLEAAARGTSAGPPPAENRAPPRQDPHQHEAPARADLPSPALRVGVPALGPAVRNEAGERPLPVVPPVVRAGEVQGAPLRSPPAAPALLPAVGEPTPEPAGGAATVRVAAEKLDALLTRSGELLVARRRVQARVEDLAALREFVRHWKAEWRTVEKALRKLLPRNGQKEGQTPPREDAGEPTGLFPRRAALALGRTGDHLRQLEKDLERLAAGMIGDGRALGQATGALGDEVRRVRMLPFAQACQELERMVHDLAQAGGKEVDFVLQGGEVELDRSVLEGLKDPLRHLVRNAVDHGAELPAERRAAGKPARARITVAAVLRGAQVEVIVADDGRGLDLEALRHQARKRKLPETADELELARLIFLPGFSTARLVTDVSGRGVGLDVVKSRVEALHGTVDLSFVAGHGTRFVLGVPLTLTMLRVLLVTAGGQPFAFVGTSVQKLVRFDPGELRSVEERETLCLGGAPVPIAGLAESLGLPASEPTESGGRTLALIVAAGERRMAFVVDEFLAEQEMVVKSLGERIRRVRHFSAATILPSGRTALVVNAANLLRTALSRAPARVAAPAPAKVAPAAKKRVLLVDDSVTTRTLEKSILEAAGYEVTAAADGAAAWLLLQERGADLVVSDVEMPRMDGFALTEAIRGSPRFHELPMVLVTARETEQDKARGLEVGADAYLVKSAFDQRKLLETIAQML